MQGAYWRRCSRFLRCTTLFRIYKAGSSSIRQHEVSVATTDPLGSGSEAALLQRRCSGTTAIRILPCARQPDHQAWERPSGQTLFSLFSIFVDVIDICAVVSCSSKSITNPLKTTLSLSILLYLLLQYISLLRLLCYLLSKQIVVVKILSLLSVL